MTGMVGMYRQNLRIMCGIMVLLTAALLCHKDTYKWLLEKPLTRAIFCHPLCLHGSPGCLEDCGAPLLFPRRHLFPRVGPVSVWVKPQREKLSTNQWGITQVPRYPSPRPQTSNMLFCWFSQSQGPWLRARYSVDLEGRRNFVFVNNTVDIRWQDDTRRMSDDHLTQRHNVTTSAY